ncbi:hypothetical protein M0657_007093 [Pyricularia oryzae]|uniref:Ribosome assembly protein 3 n=1 Tax=Pyricularia oryzae TaxID=318829 RepID=A0A4P7NFC9_PYROR|nr:hypothetical protein M0657_007093 [Pyricularia oryzae]KAI7921615.1 hypothetical protein M9X92_005265 [Pyricularia oryzae]QBZ60590.1 hypothetical protein PoMZ_07532 [Pyricularia oryzae]
MRLQNVLPHGLQSLYAGPGNLENGGEMVAWRWPARRGPTCGFNPQTSQQPGTFKTQPFDYSSTISKPSRFRSQENFEPREEKTKPAATQKTAPPEFEGFYLQQATKEFAEDLDKIRAADDFKNDAVPMLVHALKQGATMFSPAEQARIVEGTSGR